MRDAGEEVALVALVDAGWMRPLKNFRWNKIRRGFAEFGLGYIPWRIRNRIGVIRESIDVFINKLRHKYYQRVDAAEPGELKDRIFLEEWYDALSDMVPKPYGGRIDLILSDEWRYLFSSDLGDMATGDVHVHRLPGRHLGMLSAPRAAVTATFLRDVLDDAIQDSPQL